MDCSKRKSDAAQAEYGRLAARVSKLERDLAKAEDDRLTAIVLADEANEKARAMQVRFDKLQADIKRIERTTISSNSSSVRTAASISAERLRVPEASPVRTNVGVVVNCFIKPLFLLDFNSRLAVPSTVTSSVRMGCMVGTAPSRVDQGRRSYDRKKKKYEMEEEDEEEEEVEDKDWITRCICGFEDNHELMVECEGCQCVTIGFMQLSFSMWQHCLCIGMSRQELDATDTYFCEQCDKMKCTPDPARARSKMARELGKTPLRSAVPPVAATSVFTMKAKNLLGQCAMGQNAFEGELVPGIVAKMKIGPKLEGLVAEKEISAGTAVAEIVGAVSLPFTIRVDRDRKTLFIPHFFFYDGLGLDNILALDARKINQDGRYVRRSCKPNSSIQHVRNGDVTRFFIVTRNQVNRGEEITIPFDVDNQPSATVCQCYPFLHDCLIPKGNFIGPGHRVATILVKQETPVVNKVAKNE